MNWWPFRKAVSPPAPRPRPRILLDGKQWACGVSMKRYPMDVWPYSCLVSIASPIGEGPTPTSAYEDWAFRYEKER